MTTKGELLKAIRRNCIGCMGNQPYLVEGCTSPDCEMFDYRMGKDPCKSRRGFASRGKIGSGVTSTQSKTEKFSTISGKE